MIRDTRRTNENGCEPSARPGTSSEARFRRSIAKVRSAREHFFPRRSSQIDDLLLMTLVSLRVRVRFGRRDDGSRSRESRRALRHLEGSNFRRADSIHVPGNRDHARERRIFTDFTDYRDARDGVTSVLAIRSASPMDRDTNHVYNRVASRVARYLSAAPRGVSLDSSRDKCSSDSVLHDVCVRVCVCPENQ